MIRIRLKRLGRKKQPQFRIVVCDSRIRREGAPIEEIGIYNPRNKYLLLDKPKALGWVTKGAVPSETVKKLIDDCGDNGNFTPEAQERRAHRKEKLKEIKKAKEAEAKAAKEAEAKAAEEAKAAKEAEAKAAEEAKAATTA